LGAAVEVNRLRYFCVDELAAVSTLASRADLEPTEEERSIASIQPPVLVPAYNPTHRGAKGRPTGNQKVQVC